MTTTTIQAGDPKLEERIKRLHDAVLSRSTRYHSIQLHDGTILPGLQTIEHLQWRIGLFGLPDDLTGKRVLDIGAWDGWFSFECERRGAEVTAVDCVELETFHEAKYLLDSKVDYRTLDVNELTPKKIGTFDIVLFLGVLYHLRHPLLGLERMVELATDMACVESFTIVPEARQINTVMEFYERTELGGMLDNWCGPTPECLVSMCRSAGFAQVELKDTTNQRSSVLCKRRWPEPPPVSRPAPRLISAVNNRNYQARFHPLKDEYVCCFFKGVEGGVTAENLRVEVDGYGTQTLFVTADGNGGYQANCLRPVGLKPGVHSVTLRTADTERSNTVIFSMLDDDGNDFAMPSHELPKDIPDLCGVVYNAAGDLRYTGNRDGYLVCYFKSPVAQLSTADVEVNTGADVVHPDTINSLDEGVWQVNVQLQRALAVDAQIRLRLGQNEWSRPVDVERPA